jgi:glucose-1-phosphate cytidylyltransferase
MKVVLFCGGLGTRLHGYSDTVPKPMVTIGGGEPILLHLMRYYAHFGHNEFILCLGHRGDVIERYIADRARRTASEAWRITLVDTGLGANIGQRLKAVRRYLENDPVFLANYSDGLSNLPLSDYLDHFRRRDTIASFACVRPSQSFHVVSLGDDTRVRDIRPAAESELWINGGFFAFKREIFGYLGEGEDLVVEPFQRLIAGGQLTAYPHLGFWACMDTFKDKRALDDMYASGNAPWEVWKRTEGRSASLG